jgi:hypothetical protein
MLLSLCLLPKQKRRQTFKIHRETCISNKKGYPRLCFRTKTWLSHHADATAKPSFSARNSQMFTADMPQSYIWNQSLSSAGHERARGGSLDVDLGRTTTQISILLQREILDLIFQKLANTPHGLPGWILKLETCIKALFSTRLSVYNGGVWSHVTSCTYHSNHAGIDRG